MARSISEIYNTIISNKNSQTQISSLNQTSAFGIANLIFYIVAVAINIHEQMFDAFTNQIEALKLQIIPQTAGWWNSMMTTFFQYDSSDSTKSVLQISDNLVYYYQNIDPTTNIIVFCATTQAVNNRQVTIKVAKSDGNTPPNPVQLDPTSELPAAQSFVNMVQSAGSTISVVSLPADNLKIIVDIFYNAQYGSATVQNNIIIALQSFLQQLSVTNFNGTITGLSILNAIQSVTGVTDIFINQLFLQQYGGSYVQFATSYITESVQTAAGYAELDTVNSVFTMHVKNQ